MRTAPDGHRPRRCIPVSGLITAATCSALFSLLDRVEESDMYFALGLILRSVQAIGSAGYFTGNDSF